MTGFGASLQAAAPVLLGIGSQASGRDPAGIARGFALMEAKQERDQRKAAIENMMSGMGISGSQKSFLASLPVEAQQQYILQQMAPKEPVRGVVMGDRLVNPYTGEPMANFGPEPLPDDVIRNIWGEAAPVRNGIFAGESGGDYNALYGYSNRPGGAFSSVNLTDMTVNDAIQFSDPSAPYAQWVKDKVGRIATPMGAYQVVGTTLRAAKDGLGLRGDEKMTPELQERIGKWVYDTQGTGAWEGYRGPQMGGGGTQQAVAPQQAQAAPQVAQLDATIDRMTAILATGRGTDAQRKQLEFKRGQLVSERDRLRAQNEKDHLAALRARAEAGGLEEGSPEWQQFMLNNGAGGTAFTVSPDGTVSYGTGAAAANVKPPTEMQSRLSLFGGMMSATSPEIDALEERWNPANLKDNAAARMGWAGNYMRSEDAQKYETLGLAWAEGALRMSTGAAATEPEIVRVFKTYFAQPGDSAETIALKRTQRKRFEAALSAASGGAPPAPESGADVLAGTTAEEVSSGSQESAGQIDLPPDLQALFDRYPAPAGR